MKKKTIIKIVAIIIAIPVCLFMLVMVAGFIKFSVLGDDVYMMALFSPEQEIAYLAGQWNPIGETSSDGFILNEDRTAQFLNPQEGAAKTWELRGGDKYKGNNILTIILADGQERVFILDGVSLSTLQLKINEDSQTQRYNKDGWMKQRLQEFFKR